MADRDTDRGHREHRAEPYRTCQHRALDQEGRFSSDQDRYGPGSRGRQSDGSAEPWRREPRYDEDLPGHGGQEYGMEGGRGHERRTGGGREGRDERETWRPGEGEPYGDLELNPRNVGVEEFGPPHDYAYHPQAGHAFDSDYLRWREEQMRAHDRDYQDWRRARQQSYDEDYRRFRSERRGRFGRSFQDWLSQRGGGP